MNNKLKWRMDMSRPIKPTPTLYGKEADMFMEMLNKPLTEDEIEYRKRIKKRFEGRDDLFDIK